TRVLKARDWAVQDRSQLRTLLGYCSRSWGARQATCPRSWWHNFATLLQDANVDPLIRQQTLGHNPTSGSGLGRTGNYTYTRPQTQRQQIEQAFRRWPESLRYALERARQP